MRKLSFVVIELIIVSCLSNVALAKLPIGVKEGDWIEYSVSFTGIPTKGHDILWARMEVLGVDGTTINITIISMYSNGSTQSLNSTLKLETGELIDNFIIPANLRAGDSFYAQSLGNITIGKSEERIYAGASRTVLSATIGNNTYVWDQATGVSVEGTTEVTGYSMHTIVEDTNMWQPQDGADYTFLWLVLALVVVIIPVVLIAWLMKKRSC